MDLRKKDTEEKRPRKKTLDRDPEGRQKKISKKERTLEKDLQQRSRKPILPAVCMRGLGRLLMDEMLTHLHIHMHIHIHIHIHIRIHTHIRIHVHTHTYTRQHAHRHTHTQSMDIILTRT